MSKAIRPSFILCCGQKSRSTSKNLKQSNFFIKLQLLHINYVGVMVVIYYKLLMMSHKKLKNTAHPDHKSLVTLKVHPLLMTRLSMQLKLVKVFISICLMVHIFAKHSYLHITIITLNSVFMSVYLFEQRRSFNYYAQKENVLKLWSSLR